MTRKQNATDAPKAPEANVEAAPGLTVEEVAAMVATSATLPSGWAFDPTIDPPVRPATAAELAAAEGA